MTLKGTRRRGPPFRAPVAGSQQCVPCALCNMVILLALDSQSNCSVRPTGYTLCGRCARAQTPADAHSRAPPVSRRRRQPLLPSPRKSLTQPQPWAWPRCLHLQVHGGECGAAVSPERGSNSTATAARQLAQERARGAMCSTPLLRCIHCTLHQGERPVPSRKPFLKRRGRSLR